MGHTQTGIHMGEARCYTQSSAASLHLPRTDWLGQRLLEGIVGGPDSVCVPLAIFSCVYATRNRNAFSNRILCWRIKHGFECSNGGKRYAYIS